MPLNFSTLLPQRARVAPVAELSRPPSFADGLAEHQAMFGRLAGLAGMVQDTAERLAACLSTGGKLLICGNGASAAEGQHMAAALGGRYIKERRPLAAIALSADTSALTCIGNDFGFEEVFARQVRGLARAGDTLIAISAGQGSAANVLRAVEVAREAGLLTVGLLGEGNERLAAACHVAIVVPGANPVRVQEAQQFIAHSLCGLIETALGFD